MQTKKMILTAIAFMALSFTAGAQSQQNSKPYVVQTMRFEFHPGINLDSLLKVYKQSFIDPNTYVVSSKIVTHWWGHDSREVIFMYELKSLDDLDKTFEKQRDLQIAYMKDHPDLLQQFRTLFAGAPHSDEIYRIVAE